jgi:hypothetical protein
VKKVSSVVLGRPSGSGRLTNSAARTNVALLIRRAVRPCDVDYVLTGEISCGLALGKVRGLTRAGWAGEKETFLTVL